MSDRENSSSNDTVGSPSSPLLIFGLIASLLIPALIGFIRILSIKTGKPDSNSSSKSGDPSVQDAFAKPTVQPAEYKSTEIAATSTEPPTTRAAPGAAATQTGRQNIEQQRLPSTRWSLTTKYIVGVSLFLVAAFVLYISRSVLSLFIFAALIAFIIHPVIKFFQEKWRFKRGLAVAAAYLLVILLLLSIPFIFLPAAINAINVAITIDYTAIIENVSSALENISVQIHQVPVVGPMLSPAMETVVNASKSLTNLESPDTIPYEVSLTSVGGRVAQTLGLLVDVFGPVVTATISFVFMLLISVHLSLSGHILIQGFESLIPEAYQPEVAQLNRRINDIWSSFLRGQIVLMIIIGLVVWLGNFVLGTPQAFFLGLIAGLLEVIPSLGPFIATIPAVFLALILGSTRFPELNPIVFALIVIVFYMLVQALENQVVVPYVLGDAVDLPPLIVIIGVVIGGAIAGILGIFLSTPIIATGREIFNYLYDKIMEPPPPETPPEEQPSLMDNVRKWIGRVNPTALFRRNRDTPVE